MHFALQIRATRSDLVTKSECGARILYDMLGLASYLELEGHTLVRIEGTQGGELETHYEYDMKTERGTFMQTGIVPAGLNMQGAPPRMKFRIHDKYLLPYVLQAKIQKKQGT